VAAPDENRSGNAGAFAGAGKPPAERGPAANLAWCQGKDRWHYQRLKAGRVWRFYAGDRPRRSEGRATMAKIEQ